MYSSSKRPNWEGDLHPIMKAVTCISLRWRGTKTHASVSSTDQKECAEQGPGPIKRYLVRLVWWVFDEQAIRLQNGTKTSHVHNIQRGWRTATSDDTRVKAKSRRRVRQTSGHTCLHHSISQSLRGYSPEDKQARIFWSSIPSARVRCRMHLVKVARYGNWSQNIAD